MSKEGYIPISRKYFDNFLWKEERTYSKAEAWLDLIYTARFDVSKQKKMYHNKVIAIQRGELHASLRFLATRWLWSTGKVKRFLSLLESEGMVELRTEQGETIVNLCNYSNYNQSKATNETPNETAPKQPQNNNGTNKKKDNKANNGIKKERSKTICFSPPSVKQVFNFFSEKEMCSTDADTEANKFINYYESKNWMVGRSNMKNWKAAANSWVIRKKEFEKEKNFAKKQKDGTTKTYTERLNEII